jgi:hypothetical protein
LRLVLSFGTAVLGATIPGFLSVGWSAGGLTVQAMNRLETAMKPQVARLK